MKINRMAADSEFDTRKYSVRILFERDTQEADEAGESNGRGVVDELVDIDCEELARLGKRYGFDEASDSRLTEEWATQATSSRPWWKRRKRILMVPWPCVSSIMDGGRRLLLPWSNRKLGIGWV